MNILLVVPIVLGWLSGWLVNYLTDMLPTSHNLNRPLCNACQTQYTWADYLLFNKCRNCGKRSSLRRIIVQAGMTAFSFLLWVYPRHVLPYGLALLLLIYLVIVLIIDLEHRLILHPVSITGAALGLGIGIYLRGQASITNGIISTLLGGAAGFGTMLIFYFLGELFVKRMAKKRGLSSDEVALGFGDVNLSGILGLMLGWQAIFACLFFAILAGGLVSLFLIIGMLIAKKYKAFTAIPYAPFLIISAIFFLYL
jgi:prepilin signal peptidase PulO-like enzyme (type II secretory pathway)